MAETQETLQFVLREIQKIREENESLRRDVSFGINRLETQMASMQREAHRAKPDWAAASSQRLQAMLEGEEEGKLGERGQAWSSGINLYQSPRQSELAIISRMLSTECGKGPQAIAEGIEALPPSGDQQSLPLGDMSKSTFKSRVQKGRSSLERSLSGKSLHGMMSGMNPTGFFQANFSSPEKGLDRSIDELEDDAEAAAGPRNCKEMAKAILSTPIHPLSPFRTRWDLFVLMLLVYVCITAPVIVCFNIEIEMDQHNIWYFEQIVTIMFVVDIVLNFNTAYLKADDTLVSSRSQIALQYAKTWLLVDVLAVVPYELITPSQEAEVAQLAKGLRLAKFTRILRVLRVIKLLRILKVPALLRRIEGVTGRGALRSFLILGGAIFICHLVACGFFYAALLKMQDQFSEYIQEELESYPSIDDIPREDKDKLRILAWENTWVYGADLQAQGTVSRYITALYWSMSTLTTVGYGDVTPANDTEKIVSMIAMVLGVTIFAYFMGSSASLIAAMNSGETIVTRKLAQMDDFLRQRRVPRELTDKIRKFYSLAVQHQVVEDDHMVNQLSLPLRTELLLFLYRNTMEKVPFFKGQDPLFITSLVAKLRMEYYAEGDIVVQEGDLGNIMYFVVSGVLEARQYNFDRECVPPMKSRLDTVQQPSPAVRALKHLTRKIGGNRVSPELDEYSQIRQQWKFFSNVRNLKLDYTRIGRLHIGEHFGEYSCLLGHPRTSTVVSLDFTELYSLSRDDLMEVYRQWPELHKEFLDLVRQFQEITGITAIGMDMEEEDEIANSIREATDQESVHEPSVSRRESAVATEISAAVTNYRNSEVSTASVSESDGVEASLDSERTRGRKGMKKAVKLMMNMKQFDKLSTNPVFKLLNNGHDLKGMIESDALAQGYEELPPLKEEGASISRPRAKSMFFSEDVEGSNERGAFRKSASISNTVAFDEGAGPVSPPLKASFPAASDPHSPQEE